MEWQSVHPTTRQRDRRALWEALGWTAATIVLEVGAGWFYAGSIALLADSGHVAHHLFAIVVGLVALRLGERAGSCADQQRVESRAAELIGIALVIAAFLVLWGAGRRFWQPSAVEGNTMVMTAAAGAAANARVLWILRHCTSLVVRGVRICARWDLVSSVVVVGCSLLLVEGGLTRADAIGGVVVGLGVLYSGSHLLRDAGQHRH